MTDHIDGIIAGMSEAQKRYMTQKRAPLKVIIGLVEQGLVTSVGGYTEKGLAVRARLEASNG